MQIFTANTHKWIYFFCLSLVAIGLPVSEFLMSIGQILMFANILVEGRYKEKLTLFFRNKTALIVSSVMLLHLLGLLYTSDFDFGLNDIRIKAPLLLMPLFISTSAPLSEKMFNWLMALFTATVVVATFISLGVYYGIVHTKLPIVEIRDISIFISHIRFSLLICFSVYISLWFMLKERITFLKLGLTLVAGWLLTFLVFLDSLTGVVAFFATALVLLMYYAFNTSTVVLKLGGIICTLLIITSFIIYLKSIVKPPTYIQPIVFSNLEKTTSQGNPYLHDTTILLTENGNRVWIYICWDELRKTWNKRSTIEFYGNNKKGDFIKYTLVRFLTSKGLRKDAEGVNSLSAEELSAIENGIANVDYLGKSGIVIRIMETFWEFENYKNGGNINGHSAVQRIEFWKAGWQLMLNNPIVGVGTGDIKNAYCNQYITMNSPLDEQHRLRSHNQYISIAVAFGAIGLIWFLFSLIYPFVKYKMWNNYFYFSFILIVLISFLNEDTLETQPGVTFFAFFNALLLLGVENMGINKSK